MKIGYPCINRTLECSGNSTFRLKSYSQERLIKTVENNLDGLLQMLKFNVKKKILFFRITSDLVPFASHEINDLDWQSYFKDEFKEIGEYIIQNDIRISMHPDQFIVLNSNKDGVYHNSVEELRYHAQVLNLLGLKEDAKIQLHVGGVYGDKGKSMERFAERYRELDDEIKKRLIIENDDVSYTLKNCLEINEMCGVPVLFDSFHHEVNSSGESIGEALTKVCGTWNASDGLPMVDYSSQEPGEKKGKHGESMDEEDFKEFICRSRPHDFDLMLEIKDKEKSALRAVEILSEDGRFEPS